MNKYAKIISSIVIISIVIITLSGCSVPKKPAAVTKNGFYLDTIITITLYCDDASKYIDDCMDIAAHYDKLLSRTDASSDVSKINTADMQFVEVDPDVVELINAGIYYGELSDGAFDITIGKLTNLWDINNRTTPPRADEINALLGFSYKNIEIQGNLVRLTSDREMLDLGGIAKGYIADKMKEYLNLLGINEGVINLGGNVVCLDKKGGKDLYTIGIQKPFEPAAEPIQTVTVYNKSVVTSGDYQRYFEYDGKVYHHILDVSSGYPVDNDIDSVTIITDSSIDADALSTIAFTYGLKKGSDFIRTLPGTQAIFITKDGKIHKVE